MTWELEFGYSGHEFGALLMTRQFVITLIVLQNNELFPICVYSGLVDGDQMIILFSWHIVVAC
jgi:hypothetical protein